MEIFLIILINCKIVENFKLIKKQLILKKLKIKEIRYNIFCQKYQLFNKQNNKLKTNNDHIRFLLNIFLIF